MGQAFAACPSPVSLLQEKDQAPCKGWLFSPEKELEVRTSLEDYKLIQQEIVIKNKMLDNLGFQVKTMEEIYAKESQKTELWRNKAEDSTKKLIDSEDGRGKRDWLFFILGIVTTVAAGWTVKQVNK